MVTSRSGLTSVVLKISPIASPWRKWETAAGMHPQCLPAACHVLPEAMLASASPGAQSAGTGLAFPSTEPEAAARTRGESGGEGTPVSIPGLADAEEEHRVPGTLSLAAFKQPFVPPWVVCAGEPALKVQF